MNPLRSVSARLHPFRLALVATALAALAAAAPSARAQSVKDSVRVSFDAETWFNVTANGGGLECGSHIRGLHPDFAPKKGNVFPTYVHAPNIPNYSYWEPTDTVATPKGMRRGRMRGSWAAGPYSGDAVAWCGHTLAIYTAYAATLTQWAIYPYPNGTPVAKFDTSGTGLTRQFNGAASFEAVDGKKVAVASYRWTFGDGGAGATGATPAHTYTAEGTYPVTLEVTDDDGQTDSYSRNVTVRKPGLVVWAEALDPDQKFQKGDAIAVVEYVENRSGEDITDVRVPLFTGMATVYPAHVEPFYKQPARYSPVGARRDTTIAVIGAGERVAIDTYMSVGGYATYKPKERVVATEATGYAMLLGVTGKDAQGKAVQVEQKCGFNPCGNTWTVAPPVLDVELRLRTTTSADASSVKAGLTMNTYTNEPSFYGGYSATSTFDDVTCASGCVELIARVTDENGAPVEGADVRLTVPSMTGAGVATVYPRGGHVCSKLRTGQPAGTPMCNRATITIKTAADGEARAVYSVQAVTAPVTGDILAQTLDGSYIVDEAPRALTVEPNQQMANEVSLSGYDSKFVLANRQMVALGGTGNFIGDYCENSVKWGRDQAGVQNLPSLAKNSSIFLTNVGTSWVCDAFLARVSNITARGQNVLNWLTGEGGVGGNADLLKKLGSANLYLWTLGAFDVKNPHGLSSVSGPHPKPVPVQFDGDFYEWTASALGSLLGPVTYTSGGQPLARDLTGVRARMRIFEASTMQMGASATLSGSYLRAHVELDEQAGGTWKSVSATDAEYLYLPGFFLGEGRAEWLAGLVATTSAPLAEGATTATIGPPTGAASGSDSAEGAPSGSLPPAGGAPTAREAAAPPVVWAAGDVVTVGDAANAEVNQIATVAASGSSTTVTFVRPLARGYAAGATVGFLTSGATGPPAAPILVPNFADTTRTDLGWVAAAATLASTFDVEVARDSAMADLVHRETATPASRATLDVATLAQGRRYFWRVRATNLLGTGPWSAAVGFRANATGVATGTARTDSPAVGAVTLSPPAPNPASGRTSLVFALPIAEAVRVSVYDLLGREVAVLVDEPRAAGRHEAVVPASSLPPGVYVVRLVTGRESHTQRLVVVR